MNLRQSLADLSFLLRFEIDKSFLLRIVLPAILSVFIFSRLWPFPIWIIQFVVFVVIFWIVVHLVDKAYEYTRRGKSYTFDYKKFYSEWIFNGRPLISALDTCILKIQTTRAGALLRKHIWKNFEMTFKMKFTDNLDKNIGIIFRAQSLEDYFMIEIIQMNTSIYIKPHVRYRGAWEIISREKLIDLDLNGFTPIKVKVYKDTATLNLSGSVFEWRLPTHVDINHIEAGNRENKQNESKEDFNKAGTIVPKIYFRESYGMGGFRAHPGQGAEIIDLRIKNINETINLKYLWGKLRQWANLNIWS